MQICPHPTSPPRPICVRHCSNKWTLHNTARAPQPPSTKPSSQTNREPTNRPTDRPTDLWQYETHLPPSCQPPSSRWLACDVNQCAPRCARLCCLSVAAVGLCCARFWMLEGCSGKNMCGHNKPNGSMFITLTGERRRKVTKCCGYYSLI